MRCVRLDKIRSQFTDQRRFTATEKFKESYTDISPVNFRHMAWTKDKLAWREVIGPAGVVRPKAETPTVANGKQTKFAAIIELLGERAIRTRIAQPDVSLLCDGTHQLTATVRYDLPEGGFVADGVPLSSLTIDAAVTYVVTTPKLIYGYDVKTRGMFLKFEPLHIDDKHRVDGLTITGVGEPTG